MRSSILLLATLALKAIDATSESQYQRIFVKGELHKDSLTNVYIEYGSEPIEGDIILSYGSCQDPGTASPIAQFYVSKEHKPDKFTWYVPAETMSGCFSATDTAGKAIAQSEPYTITEKLSNSSHRELTDLYFNAIEYHKNDKVSKLSEASNKDKKIGIVGAGMSGLFSGFLLDQAGFHNYEILEASDRVGGRVYTVHFDDSETAYQEMGPMRFPFEYEIEGEILPLMDQRIFFQLVEELNSLNDESHKVEFIKWHQKRSNNLYYKHGFRLPDGRIPTVAEVESDPMLAPAGPDVSALTEEIDNATSVFLNKDWYKFMATNLHDAHEKAVEEGYENWPEFAWLHHKMGASLNATLYHIGAGLGPEGSIWRDMYYSFSLVEPTNWKTVQGGVSRVPQAFEPLMQDKITFGKRVSKLDYKNDKVSVQWKELPYDKEYQSKEYDNVIVAVPFSVVRTWHLPQLDFTLGQAIQNLKFTQACKVALSFSERFWEHLDRPIEGGCDQTDLFSGQICYPANNIGSSGPGVVLASYMEHDMALRATAMTEEQHVARVLEDFTELHGDLVDKYYTGKYVRHCWLTDPLSAGSWAMPLPGQYKHYVPSYYQISNGLVFVGDHTDIKNIWISGALESAIRGVVMILVENGHIDEAKAIIDRYNATWLRI